MVDRAIGILSGLSTKKYYQFRSSVSSIIATDMTRHAEHVVRLQEFIARRAENPAAEMDKQLAMQLMVKCADISNVVKPAAMARRWALRVTDECFNQGDAERAMGMEVSATCNHLAISRVALQTGFIDHVAEPLFTLLAAAFLPVQNEPVGSASPRESLDTPLAQLRDNRASYALCTDLDLERARDWKARVVAPSSRRFGSLSVGEEEGSFSRELSGGKGGRWGGRAVVRGGDGDVEVVGAKSGTRKDRGLEPDARDWSALHRHDDVLE